MESEMPFIPEWTTWVLIIATNTGFDYLPMENEELCRQAINTSELISTCIEVRE